ncbi:MAG: hypothetical protein H7Y11_00685 [Armatimonadetes bacterium]|nr:hypothetical protein [Anaerolineae bacterium]
MRIWDAISGNAVQAFAMTDLDRSIPYVFWNEDGTQIGAYNRTQIVMWDVLSGNEVFLERPTERIVAAALQSNNELFYITSAGALTQKATEINP